MAHRDRSAPQRRFVSDSLSGSQRALQDDLQAGVHPARLSRQGEGLLELAEHLGLAKDH